MSINYTQEQVEHMIEAYTRNPNRETVENLAEDLDKSIKSIIGKLCSVSERAYLVIEII